MRVRDGFVSNSSSSSFIIVMDELSRSSLESLFDSKAPQWVLDRLMRDLKEEEGQPLTEENLPKISSLLNVSETYWGNFSIPMEFEDAFQEYMVGERSWASLEETLIREEARELVKKFPGGILFLVSYSDEDGQGDMEHGDHWRLAKDRVTRVSHH